MAERNFASPTYPYEKVTPGSSTYKGVELIPDKIIRYLMDMPDRYGYTPVDDNTRPRVRFIKYLWHDGITPLDGPLPSPAEKRSLLFDPRNPVVDTPELQAAHPKGYRLYGQGYFGQSQTEAKTTVKVFLGRIVPRTPFYADIGLYFEIFTNVTYETNMGSDVMSRTMGIEQAIIESLHGVNITGVGGVSFDRANHSDSMSRPQKDEGTNVGRLLHMSIAWMGGEDGDNTESGVC